MGWDWVKVGCYTVTNVTSFNGHWHAGPGALFIFTHDMAEGGIGNAKGYSKRTLVRFSWSHTLIISNRYSYFDPITAR